MYVSSSYDDVVFITTSKKVDKKNM